MGITRAICFAVSCCVAATLAGMSAGHAQTYPVKPVRMLVGFPPGGSTDPIARLLAQRLSERFGQQVVVDNRGGAEGNIAADLAARATPDGYTLFMASASLAISTATYRKLPFDVARDFSPVTLITSSPFLLVVQPGFQASSVKELIALAKAAPDRYTYGAGGATSHLAGELFNSMAGTRLVHVPYKSTGPAMTDLLGGHISMVFAASAGAAPQVQAGKLRALATTGKRRLSTLPQVPTVAESGLPGYEVNSWSGLLVPKGTPSAIISKLNTEIAQFMANREIRDQLPAMGIEGTTTSPEEFASLLRNDMAKWAKVVAEAGIPVR